MKQAVLLVCALALVVFAVQNADVVQVRFLVWSFSISRALMIAVTFLLGAIFGWAVSWSKRLVKAPPPAHQRTR